MTCPDCGAQNASDAEYCIGCARALDDVRAKLTDEESETELDGWEPEGESYKAPYEVTLSPVSAFLIKIAGGFILMLAGVLMLAIAAGNDRDAIEPAFRLVGWGTILLASTILPIYTAWKGHLPSFLKRTSMVVYDSPPLLAGKGMPVSRVAFPMAGAYLLGLMLWYHAEIPVVLSNLTILAVIVVSVVSVLALATGRIEFRADGLHASHGLNPSMEYWVPYRNISSIDVRWRVVIVKLRGVPKRYSSRLYLLRSNPERFRADLSRVIKARSKI